MVPYIDELKVEQDGSETGTVIVRGPSIVEPLDLDNIDEIRLLTGSSPQGYSLLL